MSEARIQTYVVAFDDDDYLYPLAATLTHARADSIIAEIVEGLVEEARRRWKAAFEDDPEIRPFDEEGVRGIAEDRVIIANWDVPFVGANDPLDPHVLKLVVEYEEDHYDGEMFTP